MVERFVLDDSLVGIDGADQRPIVDTMTGETILAVWPGSEDFYDVAYPYRAPHRDSMARRICDLLNKAGLSP